MIKERFRTAIDVAVTVDYDANNTPHLQEMTWYLPAPCLFYVYPLHHIRPFIHPFVHSNTAFRRSTFRGLLHSREEPPFRCPSVSTIPPLDSTGMSPFSKTMTLPSLSSDAVAPEPPQEKRAEEAEEREREREQEALVREYVRSASSTVAEILHSIDSLSLDTELVPFRPECECKCEYECDCVDRSDRRGLWVYSLTLKCLV